MAQSLRWAAVALIAAAAVSACGTKRTVSSLEQADQSWVTGVHIGAITVDPSQSGATTEVVANLERHLNDVMSVCINGSRPVDLHVTLDYFKDNNAAAAIFIGDTINLSGSVELRDPATSEAKGQYYIDLVEGSAGIIGAFDLSGAEDYLPRIFAEQVCEEVFAGTPPGIVTTAGPGASAAPYQPPEETE